MTTNLYFSQKVRSEQSLYEDIVIESLKMYGQDVYYLPRDIVNEDRIFGDDVPSRFNSAYKIEMYVENTGGFDGEGDLFTKFGVEIRDEATFVVARRRWNDTVKKYDNEITSVRPLEGDLIYLPLSNSMFEITHVEHEQPFYQLSNLPTYKLKCVLFEYSDEEMSTGVIAVDDVQRNYAYKYKLEFTQTRAIATVPITETNTLGTISITNQGAGYASVPAVTISNYPTPESVYKFGNSSLHPSNTGGVNLIEKSGTYSANTQNGYIEFWVYLNSLPSEGVLCALLLNGRGPVEGTRSYRYQFGVNSDGRIVQMNIEDADTFTVQYNILGAPVFTTNTWHHVRISYRGSPTGFEVRTRQFYVDGQLVWRDNSTNGGGLLYDEYVLGGSATWDGIEFIRLDGYIDDYFASTENPDYVDTIDVPTTARSLLLPGAVAYENFDVTVPTATASLTDGRVTGITITNGDHNYWRVSPTLSIAQPVTPTFTLDRRVSQTLESGAVVSGKVSRWNTNSLILELVNVGSDDGAYHEFEAGRNVTDEVSGDSLPPSAVSEEQQIMADDQNDDFETYADNIIDFTESNPFGDPNET